METTDKPDHIKWALRTFSNEEIEGYLTQDPNFRNLNPAHRDNLYEAMLNGWWDPGTGEALSFDADNQLVNGQHRMAAAKLYQEATGKMVWFWCALGVSAKSGLSVDQGAARRFADYLRHQGVPYVTHVAAIVTAQCRMALRPKGTLEALWQPAGTTLTVNGGRTRRTFVKKPSIAQLLDQFKRHRKQAEYWAAVAEKLKTAGLPRGGLLASAGFQFAKVDETDAALFFSYLVEGTNLKPNDPVYLLRERLLAEKNVRHRQLHREMVLGLLVKAWVAWREGRTMSMLKFSPGGAHPEAFPDHRVMATS